MEGRKGTDPVGVAIHFDTKSNIGAIRTVGQLIDALKDVDPSTIVGVGTADDNPSGHAIVYTVMARYGPFEALLLVGYED